MKVSPYLFMLAAASITGSWLFAAEPASPPKVSDKAAESKPASAEAPADDSKAVEEKSEADEAAADKAGEKGKGSPQRFIPSEQVRADFDVSFPIDI